MSYMTIRQIRHQMCLNKLRDLGCKVVSVQGVMFYIKYALDDFKIEYLYYRNTDNTYYLERIRPYVVSAGSFDTEEEVVKAIQVDINQFKNAKCSKNFHNFIEVDTEITNAVRAFEDLYLYYNISKEDAGLIHDHIKDFMALLNKVKDKSNRVFYDTEPKSFEDQ